MPALLYTSAILVLSAGLVLLSYLDRVYRELGRVTTGRVYDHLGAFESDVEPHIHLERRRAALAFSLLTRLCLVLVSAITARAVIFLSRGTWEGVVEMIVFLGAEVVIAMQFFPALLITRAPGNWVRPLLPLLDPLLWLLWPVRASLEFFISVLHLSEDESTPPAVEQQQAIEAIVDAATEEGIIEQEEARLIEQVVEFGEKRVRDLMTPRPDVAAIPASATIQELRQLLVRTKFSRIPVYEKSLEDVVGIVMARDILDISEKDAAHRRVRELLRPALFVPESKYGSELLEELQRKNQQMAIVIDEYGLLAGIVTVEDLIEEIIGEIGEEDRRPLPDVIREASGAMVIRGSAPVDKVAELFNTSLDLEIEHAGAATIAGLLNSVAGHVPRTGEIIDAAGLRFEVLDANQRKVLRVRARPIAASSPAASAQSV
jgi:putative hemolysin